MRRQRRRRSARRPMLYAPIPLGDGPPRQSRWRRRTLAVVAMLIVLSAAAAVVAEATNRPSGRRPERRPVAVRTVPPRAAVHAGFAAPRRPAARPAASSDTAVENALRYTPLVTGGIPRHRVIALTFDDGPSPYTPRIVAELVRMHAAATFFVVGQQLEYFSAGLQDEVRHGFEIGDHTENHRWLIELGSAEQYLQIHSVAEQIQRLGAPAPRLFRPPYGAYDAATLSVLHTLGMLGVLWSVDPGDWRRPGTDAIIRGVLSAARPGAIVELHDGGGDRSETAAALPVIVEALRRRGYELVTVSKLLALDPPPRLRQLPHLGAA